jgi:hypothetical protein
VLAGIDVFFDTRFVAKIDVMTSGADFPFMGEPWMRALGSQWYS